MYDLGQYIPRKTPVHNRDPRVKIIVVIAFSIIILHVDAAGLLMVTGVFSAILMLAHIPPVYLFKNLRPVLFFFFMLFLLYLFFTPGSPVPPFPIGPVQISYQGLHLGVLQVWRFTLLVIAASILTMTTSPSELTIGLEQLLRPIRIAGISSHDIAMMVSLALRFVPTLLEEMNKMREAQLARGADFGRSSLKGKIRDMYYMAVPLAINVFRRCDELVDAMEARGYQPGPRTYLQEFFFTPLDYLVVSVIIILLIATFICFK